MALALLASTSLKEPPPAWDATAAPRLRVAAAKVDEGLLFPLAGDNVHARRVIPASRKNTVGGF